MTAGPYRRARQRGAFLLLLILPLLLGCSGRETSKLLVLGFDGLDPDAVDQLLAEGKLPHFARLRQQGAYGRLRSFRPMLSPILWTTIATGQTPDRHGIGHFTGRDRADGEEEPVTSDLRRTRAIWNLFSQAERSVGVLGWWATYPPEKVRGFIASDRLAWHFLFPQGFAAAGATGATWPADLEERLRPKMTRPESIGLPELSPYVDVTAADLARPFDLSDDLQHFRWVLATLRSYRDLGLELWQSERPDLMMVYFEGTDSTAHLFGHLFRSGPLGGELAAQQRRYGHAVERIYETADQILGEFMDRMDRETTLMVLSDHGFELGRLPDDPSQLRDMRRVSERFHRDHGVLYLYGHRVRPYAKLEEPTLLDVTPTLLALAGLPPARDMPGRVLSEGLLGIEEPERIATYEEDPLPSSAADAATPAANAADRALLDHLKSLGYLSATSSRGDRNLAAIAFENRDFRKAAELYHALVEAQPNDPGLRASFAGALGALGRYEEALRELDRSLALDRINPEGHHNRGAALERLGRRDEAIAAYREAVRYRGDYEPSIAALKRLGALAPANLTRSVAEQEATALADRASQLARRGDYAAALGLLGRAHRIAPKLALVCQYEANVSYLAGRKSDAEAALERCLTLEPDNELFRLNLSRLREAP